jgi:hypothetical protein
MLGLLDMNMSLKEIEKHLEETNRALQAALLQSDPSLEGAAPGTATGGAEGATHTAAAPEPEKKKDSGSARGIETMFRTSYQVQMDLTGLADNKANMMISINGIIISIIIAALAPKIDTNPWLLVPTTVFLLGTLVSMVYAVLAARPRVSSEPITLTDLQHSKGNILFFGNFANLGEEDFLAGMSGLMNNRELLYETMIRNIYGVGMVLKKKFRLLQIAYTVFMFALVLGVLSFIGVFLWVMLQAPLG